MASPGVNVRLRPNLPSTFLLLSHSSPIANLPIFHQVLRWSALGAGIFYGIYRQSVLSAKTKFHEIDAEYEQKSKLIQKAKAEWTKRNMPKESKTEGGGSKCFFLWFSYGFFGRGWEGGDWWVGGVGGMGREEGCVEG